MIVKKTNGMDGIYIFGGGLAGDIPVPDCAVYCLDLDSLFWVRISIQQDICPSPRLGHTLSIIQDSIYCFGGMDKQEMYNEMYKFDLSNF